MEVIETRVNVNSPGFKGSAKFHQELAAQLKAALDGCATAA